MEGSYNFLLQSTKMAVAFKKDCDILERYIKYVIVTCKCCCKTNEHNHII